MGLFDAVGKVLGGASKSKSNSEPWKEAQPYLIDTMEQAGQFFNDGTLGGVRPFLGDQTRNGMSGIASIARNNPITTGATAGLAGLMGQSAYNTPNISPGAVAGPGSFDVAGSLPQGPASYGGIAQNFGIDAVRENILDTTLPAVAGMFGQGGLVNSTTAQQVASDAITSQLAPYEYDQINRNQQLDINQFNTEQDRDLDYGLARTGMEADQFNTDESRRLGFDVNERNIGLGQENTNADRAFQQYIDQGNQKLNAIGLAPAVNEAQYSDAETLFNLGQFKDAHKTSRQEFDLNNLNASRDFFLPFGQLGTQSTNQGSPLDTIGKIGQTATSLFAGFCDRRLKRDITRVGTWRGVAIYTFRYLWDDVLRIGPMAQEVPERARIKVGEYYAVNFGAI